MPRPTLVLPMTVDEYHTMPQAAAMESKAGHWERVAEEQMAAMIHNCSTGE